MTPRDVLSAHGKQWVPRGDYDCAELWADKLAYMLNEVVNPPIAADTPRKIRWEIAERKKSHAERAAKLLMDYRDWRNH